MGEYEPKDSRIITQNPSATPLEPERTGPREGGTRDERRQTAADKAKVTEPGEADDADRWQVTETNRRFEERSEKDRNE